MSTSPSKGPGRVNQGPCAKCKKLPNDDDTDACLGQLPWVMNACCGHGDGGTAYVQFSPRVRIAGPLALVCMWALKKARIPSKRR